MSSQYLIRAIQPEDKPAVLRLLRGNTPRFFAPSEEADLIHFLDNEPEDYFVLCREDQILGSGGFSKTSDPGTLLITWDLIHPEAQRSGLGSRLMRFRLDRIRALPGVHRVRVRTSQLVYPFYQKFGFQLERTEEDFWATGFHLYQMTLIL